MGEKSKIEWTDHTWNPWYGCPDDGKRSPACDNCYARAWANRSGIVEFDREIKRASDATFCAPLNRKKYKSGDRVFVCSLSDFFHQAVPSRTFADALDVIHRRDDLTWIFLTKRPENISIPLNWPATDASNPPLNWWLGVTVENQAQANQRIPLLLNIPAAVRFVSCEPLLGAVDLRQWITSDRWYLTRCPKCGWVGSTEFAISDGESCQCPKCYAEMDDIGNSGLDWVIAGGESGAGARPMHPDWARSLRDQCAAAGVPFLFKQWGEWVEESFATAHKPNAIACGKNPTMVRVGKKEAGRLLDGVEHNGYPGQKGGA